MGLKVSAATAAKLVHRHERVVRGWIDEGKLKASREGDSGPYQVDVSDLERVVLRGVPIEIDRAILAEMEAQEGRSPGGLMARVERLERENASLRGRLEAIERLLRAEPRQARQDGQERATILDDQSISPPQAGPALSHPSESFFSGGTLPVGYVSLNAFALQHSINDSSAKDGMKRNRFTVRHNPQGWRVGAAHPHYALDQADRRAFIEWARNLSGFRQCSNFDCECHMTGAN